MVYWYEARCRILCRPNIPCSSNKQGQFGFVTDAEPGGRIALPVEEIQREYKERVGQTGLRLRIPRCRWRCPLL